MSDHRSTRAMGRLPLPGSWLAGVAVVVVTILTATSVGALVAYRHASRGGVASAPRLESPSPVATPVTAGAHVYLSVPSANVIWALVDYDHLYVSNDQGDHWQPRSVPDGFGVRPTMSFVDDHEGWLLAPGSPATQCEEASSALWHTTDGGKVWKKLPAAGIRPVQCKELVYFADARHGFIAAWDDNHSPTVYASADGGLSWRASALPDNPIFVTKPGGFALRVDWIKSFGGVTYLMASGNQQDPTWPRNFVYVSTDGGATWTWKQKVPTAELVLVTELRWLEIGPPGQLDESTNGGQATGPYENDLRLDRSDAPGQILFGDASVGYGWRGGTLQRTRNGGAHWMAVGAPGSVPEPLPSPSPSVIPMPSDAQLSAPTDTVVWALVAGGYLFRSTDAGVSWQRRQWAPYQGGGGTPVISFTNDQVGYALFPGVPATQCGQAGAQLWTTQDGAATWSLVAEVGPDLMPPGGLPFDQCKEYTYF